MTTTAARDSIRRNVQGQRTREEILDAASRLMSEYGYDGASISAILKETGLRRSSLYWQFESKAEIAAAVMERGARNFFDATTFRRARGGAGARLRAYLRQIADNLDEHQEFLRLLQILALTNQEPRVAEVLARVRAEARTRMHEFIASAFEDEGPEAAAVIADRLAELGVALFDGYFLAAQIDGPGERRRRVLDMAAALEHYGNAIAGGLRKSRS